MLVTLTVFGAYFRAWDAVAFSVCLSFLSHLGIKALFKAHR